MAVTITVDQAARDLARLRFLFVNVYLCGTAASWVLIDGGLRGCAGTIMKVAADRFGTDMPPQAIVLTHGHFDHVGAFPKLFEHWDVPVYAHRLEMPHLTGRSDYPAPDPTVGEGAMALMSFAYPNAASDFGARVKPLPDDGSVPHMPGWRWIHTPGHTAGHISLFRDDDRCLIAGDAFVTVKQESLYAVATQEREVHGPPAYFTPDWGRRPPFGGAPRRARTGDRRDGPRHAHGRPGAARRLEPPGQAVRPGRRSRPRALRPLTRRRMRTR